MHRMEVLRRELPGGGVLTFDPAFLTLDDADRALAALLEEVPFEQRDIVMFGKRVARPRLVAWLGDPGARYKYSGVTLDPLPWSPTLAALRDRVAERAGHPFNSVLANLYRDGQDSMGFHADDEPELGVDPVLASLSLGATRTFVLKARASGVADERISLTHGSLLVMGGRLQSTHRHGVPKERRVHGPRINLTFRRIVEV